jgi:serpin B
LKNVNFKVDTDREVARKDINSWVERKTNDKIKNLVQPGDLDSMTRLVLVNVSGSILFMGKIMNPSSL